MIEITLTEIVLFGWAMIATAAAIKLRQEADMSKHFIREIITNDVVREQVLSAYKEAHRKHMERKE